ncbi:MAG: aspartate 1-decarboxylase [Candidatus Delongbacteria bacterium]|nr:aspartate 1-decarboxylase [Candidatus Delongbacteria bacterium]
MLKKILTSKIHRARITDADLNYTGSIGIDRELLDAAGMRPYEVVDIYNINNGERFSTYIIEGRPGSGEIVINGAAARKVQIGDLVIIAGFGYMAEPELETHHPRIVFVDHHNRILPSSEGNPS